DVGTVINSLADFTASATAGGGLGFVNADNTSNVDPLTGGSNGTTTATYDAVANLITVNVGLNATVNTVTTAIDGLPAFTATANSGGTNTFSTSDFATKTDPLSSGLSAGLGDDLVVRLVGSKGSEVLNFKACA